MFLILVEPETSVSVLTPGDNIHGRKYKIQCDIQGGRPVNDSDITKYIWKKGGNPLGYADKVLEITSLNYTSDDGNYSCAAGNLVGVGDDSQVHTLMVHCKWLILLILFLLLII